MIKPYFDELDLEGTNFSQKPLDKGEYENCLFTNCSFTEVNLSEFGFIECQFINCDFSNATITHTMFRDVQFKGCKLLGLQFNECNELLFSATFESCDLRLASFFRRKLKNCSFLHSQLHEVDFAEADLQKARFEYCDFSNALFDRTNLTKVDLSSCYNFTIDPDTNTITKACFSSDQLIGLLRKYQINVK